MQSFRTLMNSNRADSSPASSCPVPSSPDEAAPGSSQAVSGTEPATSRQDEPASSPAPSSSSQDEAASSPAIPVAAPAPAVAAPSGEPESNRACQLYLRTRRLVLHDLSPDDAPALYEYRSDPRVAEFQSFHPRSLSDAVQFIAASNSDLKPGDHWFQLGMYLENRLIGDLGIHYPESCTDTCELGYTVSPPFQRAGFGKEAVTAVIGHLFSRRGMRRIIACLDSRNMASMALLAGLNFCRLSRQPLQDDKSTQDVRTVFSCGPEEILMELSRSDWP